MSEVQKYILGGRSLCASSCHCEGATAIRRPYDAAGLISGPWEDCNAMTVVDAQMHEADLARLRERVADYEKAMNAATDLSAKRERALRERVGELEKGISNALAKCGHLILEQAQLNKCIQASAALCSRHTLPPVESLETGMESRVYDLLKRSIDAEERRRLLLEAVRWCLENAPLKIGNAIFYGGDGRFDELASIPPHLAPLIAEAVEQKP